MYNVDQADEDGDEMGDVCDGIRQIRGGSARCAAVSPASSGLMLFALSMVGLLRRRRQTEGGTR
jgi:uncharacterized protein (TIGR03382 family)